MALPTLSNQYYITDYSSAAKFEDCNHTFKILMKRRYFDAANSVQAYDTTYISLTSDLVNVGKLSFGFDNGNQIIGESKLNYINLVFDNIKRKYNVPSDTTSLWNNASITYYIHDSLVEIYDGYITPSLDIYYLSTPIFRGLLKVDTLNYQQNKAYITADSVISFLKQLSIKDMFPQQKTPQINAYGMLNTIEWNTYKKAPSEYGLTFSTKMITNDFFIDRPFDQATNAYDMISLISRQSGSYFTELSPGEIAINNFGNSYFVNTLSYAISGTVTSPFIKDSNSVNYYVGVMSSNVPASGSVAASATFLNLGTTSTPMLYRAKLDNGLSFGAIQLSPSTGMLNMNHAARFPAPIAGQYDVKNGSMSSWSEAEVNLSGFAATNNYCLDVIFRINTKKYYAGNSGIWNAPQTGLNNSIIQTSPGSNSAMAMVSLGYGLYDGLELLPAYKLNTPEPFRYPLELAENCWHYLAITKNSASNSIKYYLNGTILVERAHTYTQTLTSINISSYTRGLGIDFGYMMASNINKTESDIKYNVARIYKQQINYSGSAISTFTNYGPTSDIFNIDSYNLGYENIYNVIDMSSQIEKNYETRFVFVPSKSITSIQLKYGSELAQITSYTISATDTIGYFRDWINGTLVASISAGIAYLFATMCANQNALSLTELIIKHKTNDPREILKSQVILEGDFTTILYNNTNLAKTTYNTVNSLADYYFCFNQNPSLSAFIFKDTLSVQKYGQRLYPSQIFDGNNSTDFSNTVILARSLLDIYSNPVPTIRFVGKNKNLSIMDKINITYQPPVFYDNNYVRAGESIGSNYNLPTPSTAGDITWTSKDFFIVGMEFDISRNQVLYTGREVV